LKKTEIELKYNQVCQYVMEGKLKPAIDLVAELIRYSGQQEHFYELDELTDNYKALLKYAFDGYHDPQQQFILNNISATLLSMADDVFYELSEEWYPQRKVEQQLVTRKFGETADIISENIDRLFFSGELAGLMDERKGNDIRQIAMEQFFKMIWLTRIFKEPHLSLIRQINNSANVIIPEKCLVVSAITLSLLNAFDPRKFQMLFEFIEKHEDQVEHRALTGLLLALIRYDKRIRFYPSILAKLDEHTGDGTIHEQAEIVLQQLLMAKETEKITRQFEEEVLPEMKKMMPRLEDKLQLDNLFENDDPEDKNPGWKEIMDEVPGLFEKIEKFTRMQMEGADVFMGTFSMLKRFDFFNRISNWFVPFYAENPELQTVFDEESEFDSRLLKQLEKAFYICNSDKYSFALNFRSIPQQQKSMIVTQFEAEMEQMNEMVSEEEVLGQKISSNAILIQYIQDIYRFFKLYPTKSEFQDPFLGSVDFGDLYFFREYFERTRFLEKVAHFYFENDHFPEAINIYAYLVKKEEPAGEHFEKIAYSYQKLGKYREAIDYYRKAELFDSNRLWILKKLGWCYLKLKDPQSAIPVFVEAARIQPDNLTLQAQIGQCYLSLGQYQEALDHYGKVRYFQPENLKVLRPVAYCHFVLGILDEAYAFYNEILASGSATSYDYMNAGHVLLCLGKKKEALEHYAFSFRDKNFPAEAFRNAFREDSPHLIRNGVKKEDLPLVLDTILFEN
jgi:tetratricopeptide (TPR) repeat protein